MLQTKTSHEESYVVSKPAKSGFSCTELGMEVHAAGLPKFSPEEEVICLSLAIIIWYFTAKHVFLWPFSQVSISSDSKPVKRAGKGSEFSTSQHWENFRKWLEVICIADRNLIWQVWFCFLDFRFLTHCQLSWLLKICASTWCTGLTSVRLN